MSRKFLSGFVIFVAAAGLGIYLSRGPWLAYRQQKLKADTATREMMKSEEQKSELLQQQAKFGSPIGQEELARGIGYRKEGEVPAGSGN